MNLELSVTTSGQFEIKNGKLKYSTYSEKLVRKVTNFITGAMNLCDLKFFDNFHLHHKTLFCFTSHLELLGTN